MNAKALIVGIGNKIRQDDGIGHYCIDLIRSIFTQEQNKLVDYMVVHQLDIIFSETFGRYSLIVFVDADGLDGSGAFRIEEVRPEPGAAHFTTHIGSIGDIMSVTDLFYGVRPQAFLVAVQGSDFEVGEELSSQAKVNAQKAAYGVSELVGKFLPLG